MPRDAHPGAKALAREFRRNPTESERAAWQLLRYRRCLGLRFRRQEAISHFVIDFYCPAIQLGLEIDGPVHRYDGAPERDQERDLAIKALGVDIVRIRSDSISMSVFESALRPFLEPRRWQ